jgi:hypothetical protein
MPIPDRRGEMNNGDDGATLIGAAAGSAAGPLTGRQRTPRKHSVYASATPASVRTTRANACKFGALVATTGSSTTSKNLRHGVPYADESEAVSVHNAPVNTGKGKKKRASDFDEQNPPKKKVQCHLMDGDILLQRFKINTESRDIVYALAVEDMDTLSFTQARELAQVLPSPQSRERIRRRLSSSAADDELSIVSDYLTVNLVDPFMARIFNIPARGIMCGHLECFDLETYIMTRASKEGKVILKENWKCPICSTDACPQNLIVDGFLSEVRADLAHSGRLEGARAIKIKADGSWELRSDGESTSYEGVVSPLVAQRPKTEGAGRESLASRESSASLVIELD